MLMRAATARELVTSGVVASAATAEAALIFGTVPDDAGAGDVTVGVSKAKAPARQDSMTTATTLNLRTDRLRLVHRQAALRGTASIASSLPGRVARIPARVSQYCSA